MEHRGRGRPCQHLLQVLDISSAEGHIIKGKPHIVGPDSIHCGLALLLEHTLAWCYEQHYMYLVYKEIIWDISHFTSVERVGTHREEYRGFLGHTLITLLVPGLKEGGRPGTERQPFS